MNPFDWVLAAIAGFFALKGIINGAVREVFSLAALLLACVAAFCYYPLLLPLLQPHIVSKWGQHTVACSAVFLLVWIGVNLIGWLIARFLKLIKLGFLDHLAGAFIGGVKAYVLGCVLVVVLVLLPVEHEILKDSRLAPYAMPMITRTTPYLPEVLRKALAEKMNRLPQTPVRPFGSK